MRWTCPLGCCAVLSIACAASDPDDAASTAATDAAPTTSDSAEDGGPGSGADPSADADPSAGDDSSADADPSAGDDPGSDDTSGDPSVTAGTTDDPPPADQLPPIGAAALEPWLASLAYADWHAESAVHVSTGPHGDGVRTFFNDALFDSFEAGNAVHPIDAAVVKELYGDGEIAGWAVMVKVADGEGGDTWYWYEVVGASTYADGTDVALCTGCHAVGVDQIQTPYPLQ